MPHDTMVLSIFCRKDYRLDLDEWQTIRKTIERALVATGLPLTVGEIGYLNNIPVEEQDETESGAV